MTSLPDIFNAATHFVDRHVAEGRGARVAIECGDECVTYGEVAEEAGFPGDMSCGHVFRLGTHSKTGAICSQLDRFK